MRSNRTRLRNLLLIVLLICVVGLFTYRLGQKHSQIDTLTLANEPPETTSETDFQQLLKIHAIESDDHHVIEAETLGGGFDRDIVYWNVAAVTIEIDGKVMQLYDAIRDGHITAAEMFAYARLDAANGYCTESYKSTRTGLTAFIYTYEEVDLWMLYDVLYAPDGQTHKITKINIYRPGMGSSTIPGHYRDLETGEWLDREDWGLEFTVTETSPTQLTLQCSQAGGQHFGQLYTTRFTVTDASVQESEQRKYAEIEQEFDITNNGTTEFTVKWNKALPSGDYSLNIRLADRFQGTDIHPLTVDFYMSQDYDIPFSIP